MKSDTDPVRDARLQGRSGYNTLKQGSVSRRRFLATSATTTALLTANPMVRMDALASSQRALNESRRRDPRLIDAVTRI